MTAQGRINFYGGTWWHILQNTLSCHCAIRLFLQQYPEQLIIPLFIIGMYNLQYFAITVSLATRTFPLLEQSLYFQSSPVLSWFPFISICLCNLSLQFPSVSPEPHTISHFSQLYILVPINFTLFPFLTFSWITAYNTALSSLFQVDG